MKSTYIFFASLVVLVACGSGQSGEDASDGQLLDLDAPASARVSAARTALELAGDLGKAADTSGESKSLAEMSPDELARLIDSWEQQRSALATDITPQTREES